MTVSDCDAKEQKRKNCRIPRCATVVATEAVEEVEAVEAVIKNAVGCC